MFSLKKKWWKLKYSHPFWYNIFAFGRTFFQSLPFNLSSNPLPENVKQKFINQSIWRISLSTSNEIYIVTDVRGAWSVDSPLLCLLESSSFQEHGFLKWDLQRTVKYHITLFMETSGLILKNYPFPFVAPLITFTEGFGWKLWYPRASWDLCHRRCPSVRVSICLPCSSNIDIVIFSSFIFCIG